MTGAVALDPAMAPIPAINAMRFRQILVLSRGWGAGVADNNSI